LGTVNSSATMARQPEVPNLIGVVMFSPLSRAVARNEIYNAVGWLVLETVDFPAPCMLA
jgi:hypothetical protein